MQNKTDRNVTEGLGAVLNEMDRQDGIHGTEDKSAFIWLAILSKEIGAFSRSILKDRAAGEQPGASRNRAVRIAAVALQIINQYDGKGKPLNIYEINRLRDAASYVSGCYGLNDVDLSEPNDDMPFDAESSLHAINAVWPREVQEAIARRSFVRQYHDETQIQVEGQNGPAPDYVRPAVSPQALAAPYGVSVRYSFAEFLRHEFTVAQGPDYVPVVGFEDVEINAMFAKPLDLAKALDRYNVLLNTTHATIEALNVDKVDIQPND